ncbi:unnamed protein product [Phytophthora fragariaefolia]|uniref:Unnamed protein product n=1 Tax=Phytophthora fragariaefolia TaxID=1490495 RepID=A0A9W6Y7K1_9STRA|nr:unnamed protein product [Phytophthora fragariaefolia]
MMLPTHPFPAAIGDEVEKAEMNNPSLESDRNILETSNSSGLQQDYSWPWELAVSACDGVGRGPALMVSSETCCLAEAMNELNNSIVELTNGLDEQTMTEITAPLLHRCRWQRSPDGYNFNMMWHTLNIAIITHH